MMKTLVAGVTALSLTLASAAPAQANGLDREDVGKLLLGLLAVGVVGAAIENNQRREETQVQRQGSGSWAELNQPRPRPDNRHDDRRRILPYECLQTVETRFGDLRLFGERCLERNYRFAASLPERCEVRVYSDNGPRSGYDPLCLREQGYRTTRRH
jgi:hypothetical protein